MIRFSRSAVMNADSGRFHSRRLGRRAFLRVGTAGLAGLSLAGVLRRDAAAQADVAAPRAKNVIMIFLTGGPATIDMWDMKPDAPESIRGEFRPRDTSVAGVQICEHMPALAASMHLATLVRSVTHTIAEHSQGAAYVMTGNRPSPAIDYPSLGSLAASLLESGSGMPTYSTIGAVPSAGSGDLGTALNPFQITGIGARRDDKRTDWLGLPDGFTVADLQRRERILARLDERMRRLDASELPRQLDRFQQQALDILRSDKINQALNVSDETKAVQEQYGPSSLGRSVLAARRLIVAGARFVTVGYGDWDTHSNNFARLRNTLLPELDRGLAALLNDLDQRGLLDETIVYCTGEFGRTPGVNSAAGRDHWARSMTALLSGGGVRRGSVYGATDEFGQEPTDNPCSPDDVSASIFHQLGFSPTHQVMTRQGRPVSLFRDGRVLPGVIG
jgi:hypothetical protein